MFHTMDLLPSKPERPLDSDCCGQGCDPCILDIYAEEMKIWEEECRQIKAGEKLGTKMSTIHVRKFLFFFTTNIMDLPIYTEPIQSLIRQMR